LWRAEAVQKQAGMRGKPSKTQSEPDLSEIVLETVRLWRKHHLGSEPRHATASEAHQPIRAIPFRFGPHEKTGGEISSKLLNGGFRLDVVTTPKAPAFSFSQ
jgi:hypothetical protein